MDKQWKISSVLLNTLPLLVANLMLEFKEHSLIDFPELNIRALGSLGSENNPTDLSLLMDYKINHILIDEFQDTSKNHFQLIEKLTLGWDASDNKTIFIVGDPMQSIYKFRDANVGLFMHVQEHGINNLLLQSLTLSSNFRSHANLINWCNSIFEPSFPSQNNCDKGAVAFCASNSTINTKQPTQIKVFVSNNQQIEAQHVVNIVKKQLQINPNSSIAILARARNQLTQTISALQTENIPFIANDIDHLASKSIIQDLLALTRAIVDPTDQLAWFAILRAPWCGLLLKDLLVISKACADSTILHCMQNLPKELSSDGRARLELIAPVLIHACINHIREPLHFIIENLWITNCPVNSFGEF